MREDDVLDEAAELVTEEELVADEVEDELELVVLLLGSVAI